MPKERRRGFPAGKGVKHLLNLFGVALLQELLLSNLTHTPASVLGRGSLKNKKRCAGRHLCVSQRITSHPPPVVGGAPNSAGEHTATASSTVCSGPPRHDRHPRQPRLQVRKVATRAWRSPESMPFSYPLPETAELPMVCDGLIRYFWKQTWQSADAYG
ncbi:hypothetical protein PSTG_04012 [Puccinia striiformis f. sp. tritici PST-78]|uniref:Uncharacterized protein n=1 Tax=Puccinia striiformis f. sp. tritici PST-78 TaxID=1165861 RepID=A0A0L0VTX9_9BASI|nr:hypothetical protein PSTG_04012 [Puccinia striiformis f. sp. tritici PST-78]